MNIVLDMDGTLIDSHEQSIYTRPGLQDFLWFCFKHFETVGIWTMASEGWFQTVNKTAFQPLIADINKHCGTTYQFHFVYTRNRGTTKFIRKNYTLDPPLAYSIKPLRKLWRQKQQPHTKYNTIIVDDIPINAIENYGNAIYVHSWDRADECDMELFLLKTYLELLLIYHQAGMNIRHVEKRNWRDPHSLHSSFSW